ncbi:MAG: acyltransferase family protein [Desulfomicrobium sp.]
MKDTGKGRLAAIDVARALGLALVYYGHFVEQVMYLENPAAAAQYKWIYSFHMILFFVLSGWVRGTRSDAPPVRDFVKSVLASRIVPYVFFSVLLGILSVLFTGWFPLVDLSTADGYVQAAMSTALGFPLLNVPLWFVACLVSVECLHRVLRGLLDNTPRTLMAALVCYTAGYALNEHYFFFGQGRSFWLLHEVPVVYAFYLLGVALGRQRALAHVSSGRAMGLFLMALACVHLTFDLNQGPFRYLQAVIILLSGHGHFLWFPFTALAGTVSVLALGFLLRNVSWLAFLGRNALILLGMNGVFYHFVNPPLARWSVAALPGDGWIVFLVSITVTVVSIGLSVPVILGLNAAVPQFVGKPRQAGLWFGPLVRE